MLKFYFISPVEGKTHEKGPYKVQYKSRYQTYTTIFLSSDGNLICSFCNEELGEVTDENIDHQSDYHSCAINFVE